MDLKVLLVAKLLCLLIACQVPYRPTTGKFPNNDNTHTRKVQIIKKKQWKRIQVLDVLCAEGNATCSNGGQAVCYTGLSEFGIYEFEHITENSFPVCIKSDQIIKTVPICRNKIQPVCGLDYDISPKITDTIPVCDPIGGYKSVVCPFGGNPVCIQETIHTINIETAYCVNEKNKLISGNNFDFQVFGRVAIIRGKNLVGCRDPKSIPKCFGVRSEDQTLNKPDEDEEDPQEGLVRI